jgi:hypothetical protein
MKVWDGFNWIQRIRVFAGSIISGILRQSGNISQADIYGAFIAGPIRFTPVAKPVIIELNDGNYFFDTESGDPIQDAGGLDNFRMGRLDASVVAAVDIEKSIAVVYNDDGKVIPASYTITDSEIIGVTEEAMLAGERKNIITSGFIEDKQNFSFTEPVLTRIFVDTEGNLTTVIPSSSSIQNVGYVAGVNTVYIQIRTQVLILENTIPTADIFRNRADATDVITKDGNSIVGYTFEQLSAADVWVVPHLRNTTILGVQVYIDSVLVEPDNINILTNNVVEISFSEPLTGNANFLLHKLPGVI